MAPSELQKLRQWILFDRSTKRPLQRTNQPHEWLSYEEATARVDSSTGLGLVLLEPLVGIDFDGVRDPQTGVIAPWVERVIQAVGSYTEVSPSGTGIHIIATGKVNKASTRKDGIEVYQPRVASDGAIEGARYFTFTGAAYKGGTVDAAVCEYPGAEAFRYLVEQGYVDRGEIRIQEHAGARYLRGEFEGDRSACVHAAVAYLVEQGLSDVDIDVKVRASGMYHAWTDSQGARKWDRLGETEVERARAHVERNNAAEASVVSVVPTHISPVEDDGVNTTQRITVGDVTVTLKAVGVRWDATSLRGYIEASWPGAVGRFREVVFTTGGGLKGLAGCLPGGDWSDILEDFGSLVVSNKRSLREVRPTNIRLAPRPKLEDVAHVLGPVPPLLRDGLNIWFGNGASGKSMIALYAAGLLSLQGLRVGYFDWEMTASDHALRLARLFPGSEPDIYHYRFSQPLARIQEDVKEIIKRDKLDFAIFDSAGYASAEPESSDAANQYINAASALGIGTLHLAHITKNGPNKKLTPFGSVFWHAGGRLIFYVEKIEEEREGGPDEFVVQTICRKNTHGVSDATSKPTRYAKVTFTKDQISIAAHEPNAVDIVLRAIKDGANTRSEIQAATDGMKAGTRRQALKRLVDRGVVKEEDGGRYSLVRDDEDDE